MVQHSVVLMSVSSAVKLMSISSIFGMGTDMEMKIVAVEMEFVRKGLCWALAS